jgi:hypothetical protein
VHPAEQRVVRGAQAEGVVGLEQLARLLDRGDVLAAVHQRDQPVVGGLEAPELDAVEDAEGAGQLHGQLDSDRVERVRGAEVVRQELVIPEDLQVARHTPLSATAELAP